MIRRLIPFRPLASADCSLIRTENQPAEKTYGLSGLRVRIIVGYLCRQSPAEAKTGRGQRVVLLNRGDSMSGTSVGVRLSRDAETLDAGCPGLVRRSMAELRASPSFQAPAIRPKTSATILKIPSGTTFPAFPRAVRISTGRRACPPVVRSTIAGSRARTEASPTFSSESRLPRVDCPAAKARC